MIQRSRTVRTAGILCAAVWAAMLVSAAEASTWTADSAHTEINFSVKHFFTPVSGSFGDFEVDLNYNPEALEKSSVTARIKVAGLDTGNDMRDNHLRSGDWFEAEQYPDMTFKSTSVRANGDQRLIAQGKLTIKGQTREIDLPITLLGVREIPEEMQEMLGGATKVASFKAELTIDRGDFGVGVGDWAGDVVVGSAVSIEILLEAHLR